MKHIFSNYKIYLIIIAVLIVIINPLFQIDLLILSAVGLYLAYILMEDYILLLFLLLRPVIDYWRDIIVFSTDKFSLNINAVYSLILIVWILYFILKNLKIAKKIPHLIPIGLFVLWISVGLTYSYYPANTIVESMRTASFLLIFLACYILYKKDEDYFYQKFLQTILIGAIIPITIALFQLFSRTGMQIDYISNRVYGTFAHPNVLSSFGLLLLIIACEEFIKNRQSLTHKLYLFPNKLKIAYPLYIFSLFLLLITIFFTYTRIGWIATFALFAIIIFRYARRWFFYGLGTIILLYALFFPINKLLIKNFNYNLQQYQTIARLTGGGSENYNSIQWRLELYQRSWPLLKQHPILGYGYGTFSKVWETNKSVARIWDNSNEAHNDYLKIVFETGIIGLILYLSILATIFWQQLKFALKNNWKNLIPLISVLIFLILGMSDNLTHQTPVMLWWWAWWGIISAKA